MLGKKILGAATVIVTGLIVTGPAVAAGSTGYVTSGSTLYSLDTTSLTLSPRGSVAQPVLTTARGSDGVLYGVVDSGGGATSLVTFDLSTGATTPVGDLDVPAGTYVAGLTAAADGALYASTYDTTTSDSPGQLLRVDAATAATTPVGEARPGEALLMLAGGCGGKLLGVDIDNNLVRVSRGDGALSVLGQLSPGLGVDTLPAALAYDHAQRKLWLLSGGGKKLFTVDDATGKLTTTSFTPPAQLTDPVTLAFDPPSACRYTRTLSLAYSRSQHRFSGRLRCAYAPCAANQQVALFRKRPGPDLKLATVRTSSTGSYHLDRRRVGTVYANAPRSSSVKTGVCLTARSPSVG